MIRMMASSLICIIALYIYCLFRNQLQRRGHHIYRAQSKPQVGRRGTLVKDSRTDEYYVR
ncbi:hypothetical protein Q648_00190 [Bartonella quintana JK 12]|uniref:Uncharacterized protein n=2 Tax=Bartonella quintana TaxID=803 RepID=W3TW45_BARQI|nr:hypothetical protein Q651_00313 [Bartonella quintana BQ2-D70]ETS13983.1 hypothetical protein Q650_00602 [Bartonella quintana JK 73rel]ETS15670.1 hypothetical protein Q649_00611 [Bartonella quintana JK 73]ETS17674.1 hypothetical protein Q647_00601 [Bartonella quintana JK 7]ETS18503.1 hypothetical protein Q648_00190 [Bartonella quintana JK 12]KEC59314.1 hypothetical protein O93_00645 [Bartonella quintana JK 19]KEC62579.1 hypothetical protein O7Y_00616 [Bartonella quintana JK 63]KEC63563.1 h